MPDTPARVALVVGGASGIGRATASVLTGQGCTVLTADVAPGADLLVDVTDETSVDRGVAAVLEAHGRLDVAVNAAGVSGSAGALTSRSVDEWRRTLAVNLDGVFLCLRAELRAMQRVDAPGGVIVNVASAAGQMGYPFLADYVASKHGVVGLTRSAALEVARSGIRVNCVCPGSVRTPMLERFAGGVAPMERMGAMAPLGRLGEPEEIAEVIAWLCCDAASFVTGAVVSADGGVSAA